MTTHTGIIRTLAAMTATGLLAFGLGACSSGVASTEEVCKVLTDSYTFTYNNAGDENKFKDSLRKVIDAMKINVPEDIAEDWKAARESYKALYNEIKGEDLARGDGLQIVNAAIEKLQTAETDKGAARIDEWKAENCR